LSIVDERVSQLLAEIHNQPSPEEAFSKWMFVDIFILDGLMMLFVILFLIVRDIYLVSMVGAFSISFGAVYLYIKDRAKTGMITGRDFLDSQTIIGDLEISEQIPVRSYDYVLLPVKTITGKEIAYSRVDIDDSLGTLRTVPMRVGGASALRPEVVDNLVRLRLRELKELEEERKGNKKEQKKKDKEAEKEKRGGFFSRFRTQRVKEIPKVVAETGYTPPPEPKKNVIKPLTKKKQAELLDYDDIDIEDIIFDEEGL